MLKHNYTLFIFLGVILISIPTVVIVAFPVLPIWVKVLTWAIQIIAVVTLLFLVARYYHQTVIQSIDRRTEQILSFVKEFVTQSFNAAKELTEKAQVDTIDAVNNVVIQNQEFLKTTSRETVSILIDTISKSEKNLLENADGNRKQITQALDVAVSNNQEVAQAVRIAVCDQISQSEERAKATSGESLARLTEVIVDTGTSLFKSINESEARMGQSIESTVNSNKEISEIIKAEAVAGIVEQLSLSEGRMRETSSETVTRLSDVVAKTEKKLLENAEANSNQVTQAFERAIKSSKEVVESVKSSVCEQISKSEEQVTSKAGEAVRRFSEVTDNTEKALLKSVRDGVKQIEQSLESVVNTHKEVSESIKAEAVAAISEQLSLGEGRMRETSSETVTRLSDVVAKTEKKLLENAEANSNQVDQAFERAMKSSKEVAESVKSSVCELISKSENNVKAASGEAVSHLLTTQEDSFNKINELVSYVFEIVQKLDKEYLSEIVDGLKPQFENNEDYLIIANASLVQQLRMLQATLYSLAARDIPAEYVRQEPGGIKVYEYKNEQTNEIVVNREKEKTLVSSQLYIGKTLAFEIQYDADGRITYSKNYDKKGKISSELTYHSNGQIATRKEHLMKDGKIITKTTSFDISGRKKQ